VSDADLKCQAAYWPQTWIHCGCPVSSVATNIKRKVKARYKVEVHRSNNKWHQDSLQHEKNGQSLVRKATEISGRKF